MKIRKISYYLGRILLAGAIIMLLPVIVSLIYGDGCVPAFLISAAVTFAVGFGVILFTRKYAKPLSAKEGMAVAALTWIILSVFGALPSMISGVVTNFTDAFFNSVSGYTTTGVTVYESVSDVPKSLLFWSSLTHWIGGLGILAFAMAVLPKDKSVSRDGSASETFAIKAESAGPTFGKIVSKMKFNTQIFYAIYLGFTVLEFILLVCGRMPVFDSVCNALVTMGSGGFSVTDAGIAGYGSSYIEWVITVFMILAGLNFNFYYFMLIRKFSKAFAMEEVKWYLGMTLAAVAAVSVNIYQIYQNVGESIRHAFFQVAAVMSTTGFTTVNFNTWPEFSKMLLILLMFVGGCAGSTGCGIKVSRIVVMIKTGLKEIRYYLNPREIRAIHFDKQPLDRSVITGISSYFVVFMILFAMSVLAISLNGHDFTTSVTAVTACINNIGPGLSKVGPMSNYSCMSTLSKYVLSFDMLLGRLELFPILVLLSPRSWKK